MRDRGAAGRAQREAAPVDGQHELSLDLRLLARQHGLVGRPALLERRDLGLVEDVAHVDAVRGHAHARQMVDGEVAERVRGRDGRDEKTHGDDEAGGHERPANRGSEHDNVLRVRGSAGHAQHPGGRF
jgi:hypothetical protein